MRVLRAFVVHEVRLGLRSPRLWLLAVAYIVLGLAPVVVLHFSRQTGFQRLGPATYANKLFAVQPFLTVLLVAALSIAALNRERDEDSFTVVALAPLTNAGYLFRRWLAVQALILPLTFAPVAVAAGLSGLGGGPFSVPAVFAWPWLLHVVPLVVVVSALALGLGTIARGTFSALIAALLVFGVGFGLANDVLARFGRTISGPARWFGVGSTSFALGELRYAHRFTTPATDAPYDPAAALDLYAKHGALTAGLACLVFGLAVAFLRRTRRDLRPWTVRSDHPLRSVLTLANRARQAVVPDPALAPWDRVAIVTGISLFVGAIALNFSWDARYRSRAATRNSAELSQQPAPTVSSLVPVSWSIEGEIGRRGRVRLHVSGEVRNQGEEAVDYLAFSLDPHLAIDAAATDGGTAEVRSSWDRLELRLDPPIEPGSLRRLEFDLSGVPATDHFELQGYGSFVDRYASLAQARHAHDISDLSRSWSEKAVSARRVALTADDLTPVPRYAPWTLTPRARVRDETGREVAPETVFPFADVEIDLQTPPSWVLADACGGLSQIEAGRGRLRSACRIPLDRLGVRGGRLSRVGPTPGLGGMAVLEAHVDSARLHLPSFIDAAELARKAWPGLDPLRGSVVLEWPPPFALDPTRGMWLRRQWNVQTSRLESVGRVLLVPESVMLLRQPLEPGAIAVSAVGFELMNRRRVRGDQERFFDTLFQQVAATRMGQTTVRAAFSGPAKGHNRESMATPILEAGRWNRQVWTEKLPALIADLDRRIGSQNLINGIEEFLDAGGVAPGSAEELFATLSERSGVALDRVYSDYLVGDAVPLLSLSAVRFDRRGGDWVVNGVLENRGDGETICPVVLRTDTGSIETEVTVDSESASPFRMVSRQRPRAVELDPRRVCFRFEPRPKGEMVDRVEYDGTS